MPAIRMPVLIRSDWVQNSNDSFWLSNPAITPPADIGPLVGPLVGGVIVAYSHWRMIFFVNLPMASLDRLTLQARLDSIGKS